MTILEIISIAFVVVVALSIVWSTLNTGISPMMSSNRACQAMIDAIEQPITGPIVDLGSGWGTLVIAAARHYPHQQVVGYELSWFPWMVSLVRKYSLGLDNLTLHRKDFNTATLSDTSVLFCYLFPEGMVALHKKLLQDALNDIVIVSNTFSLPFYQPTRVLRLKDIYNTPIYIYDWQL